MSKIRSRAIVSGVGVRGSYTGNANLKRVLGLLIRLLVFAALIIASVPVSATEMVCVVGARPQVVPVTKCGMPCCAHPAPNSPAKVRSCCHPHSPRVAVSRAQTCRLAGLACRCETRVLANVPPSPATVTHALPLIEQPAILTSAEWLISGRELPSVQPGIVGVDSGPPRRWPRSPRQSRAPPFVSSDPFSSATN